MPMIRVKFKIQKMCYSGNSNQLNTQNARKINKKLKLSGQI